eukprot:4759013-Pleurochrysis_carterae.AAC.1
MATTMFATSGMGFRHLRQLRPLDGGDPGFCLGLDLCGQLRLAPLLVRKRLRQRGGLLVQPRVEEEAVHVRPQHLRERNSEEGIGCT